MVADAAVTGNLLAQRVMNRACQALGWGIAQVITLLAVEVVIVGGGVSLADEKVFLTPLRRHVRRYVFPPLRGSYEISRRNSAKRSSSTEPWQWPRHDTHAYASATR